MKEGRRLKITAALALAVLLLTCVQRDLGSGLQPAGPGSGGPQDPLACRPTLTVGQSKRIQVLSKELRAARRDVRELPDGYSVQLPASRSMLTDLAEYLTLLGTCCPYFDVMVESEREGGPVWLTLSGREGVKALAKTELGIRHVATNLTASDMASKSKESPLACDDKALTATQLKRVVELVKGLRASKQEVAELADGYAIRLPRDASTIQQVAEYMGIIRICSPYFETTLQAGCEGSQLWLRVTGRKGVKELAKEEFGI